MTEELTLREKVRTAVDDALDVSIYDPDIVIAAIASILEDTGAPAHMRVAAELRGE
jgi:hypothetical protein